MALQEPSELVHLLWFAGWCVAMLVLFGLGIRLPLQRRLSPWAGVAYTAGSVMAAMVVTVLANVALVGTMSTLISHVSASLPRPGRRWRWWTVSARMWP
jgi:hypothetical protein